MTRESAAAFIVVNDEASDEHIDALEDECRSTELNGYRERVFILAVELRCDAGAEFPAEVTTDLETGRRITEAARRIIVERRAELRGRR